MQKPWVVTTLKTVDGYVFHHEADTALQELCTAFDAGTLSEAQARESLQAYADFIDLDDFEDVGDDGSGFGFPFSCDDVEFLPATTEFMDWAVRLGIPGVHWYRPDWRNSSVMTGEGYLVVDSEDALQRLRDQARGRYSIVEGMW